MDRQETVTAAASQRFTATWSMHEAPAGCCFPCGLRCAFTVTCASREVHLTPCRRGVVSEGVRSQCWHSGHPGKTAKEVSACRKNGLALRFSCYCCRF